MYMINNEEACYKEGAEMNLLEQYRTIGTVEECRRARERQQVKKPINMKGLKDFSERIYSFQGNCPTCGAEKLLSVNAAYCPRCGQAIDWNE